MSVNQTLQEQKPKSNVATGVLKRLMQVSAIILLQAALLFVSAGRLDWTMAWVYIVVYFIAVAINATFLLPRNPELVAERSNPQENTKDWDKRISSLVGIASLGSLVVSGLDYRFSWSPAFAPAVLLGGVVLLVLGYSLFSWAMVSNAFFSTLVRIQDDRGHAVVSTGPYRYVRHPGYDGWILMSMGTPVLLGSLWGIVPGALSALLMVVRTALEDRTLNSELAGYKDYSTQVRYRLLPGIW